MSDREPTAESTARPDEFDDCITTVLSRPTRKQVLAVLARAEDRLSLSDLARAVADAEDVCPGDGADRDDEQSTTVMLYHCDLPKLADHGLVEWDDETREAVLTARGSTCTAALGL